MNNQDSKWELIQLQSIASKEKNAMVGGPFGSNLVSKDYVFYGVPVIRGQNMGERWIGGDFVYVSKDKAESLHTNLARPCDIVFTQRGTLGQVSIVPKKGNGQYLLSQNLMKLTVDKKVSNSLFIYYLFKSPLILEYIFRNTIGSSVPGFNLGQLKSMQIPLPPLPTQKAIAHILGTLDDKIELNRQMNETLESIARAIFTSWFINFDPVRAKADGKQPEGMDATTAALFPSEFETVEGQEIPKGWKIGSLNEIIDVNPERKLRKGELADYLDMANVATKGHRPINWIARPFSSGMKFQNGDTILARITPCLENGKTAYVDFLEKERIGWGSTEFIILRPKDPYPPEIGYFLARNDEFRTYVIQNMTGTSGRQRASADSVKIYELTIPPHLIAEKFGMIVSPLIEKICSNDIESKNLSSIRDTLLPKLLSGELPIENPEKFIEATA